MNMDHVIQSACGDGKRYFVCGSGNTADVARALDRVYAKTGIACVVFSVDSAGSAAEGWAMTHAIAAVWFESPNAATKVHLDGVIAFPGAQPDSAVTVWRPLG